MHILLLFYRAYKTATVITVIIIFIALYKARERCERMTEERQRTGWALCVWRRMNVLTLQEGKGHKTPPSCLYSSRLRLCDVTPMISLLVDLFAASKY